ncbi:hypothetical protein JCM11641_003679 [Rhodosporidiobolus odoratus]
MHQFISTSSVYDPTNANAVAGPSRLPDATSAEDSSRGSVVPPSLPTQPTSSIPPGPSPTAARREPVRRADGPVLVKTLVGPDGMREVPCAFEHCEVDDLIALISSMLDRLIAHNDRIPLSPDSLTRFHSRAPPNITVRDYLVRIQRYTNVEPCCLLILLPYVDKVCAKMTDFTISSLTVHRFIIAAISVGSKALSDAFCTNSRYARVGGVSIVEMNLLEKEFCDALDWRLTTSGPVLAQYYTSLVQSHPSYRISIVPLPTPPPPPPISVPPPFSPPPVPSGSLALVSSPLPISTTIQATESSTASVAMDVDVDGAAAEGSGRIEEVGMEENGAGGEVAMSTEPETDARPLSSRAAPLSPSPHAQQPPPSATLPSSSSPSSSSFASASSESLSSRPPHPSSESTGTSSTETRMYRPRGRERDPLPRDPPASYSGSDSSARPPQSPPPASEVTSTTEPPSRPYSRTQSRQNGVPPTSNGSFPTASPRSSGVGVGGGGGAAGLKRTRDFASSSEQADTGGNLERRTDGEGIEKEEEEDGVRFHPSPRLNGSEGWTVGRVVGGIGGREGGAGRVE